MYLVSFGHGVLTLDFVKTRCDFTLSLPHRVLTKSRVRTPVSKGNKIYSITLWTLRYPKMYMATLGYKGKVSLLKL